MPVRHRTPAQMRALFTPILAGATLGDRLLACAGAAAGIALTSLVTALALGPATAALLVAPIGASAVLVFAVPASPLAQPWPVVGGNVLSALVGVAVAKTAAHVASGPHLAAGLAVGLAILAMSLARCLHPPGGAAALTAVIGGPEIAAAGWSFALVPVGVDAALLVLAGVGFHRISGHAYPHRSAPPQPHPEDLDAALAAGGETYDIARDDLAALIARVEAARRARVAAAARVRQRRRRGEG